MVCSKIIGGRVIGILYWGNASFFGWALAILPSEYIGVKLLVCETESALLFMLLCFTLFSPGALSTPLFSQKRKQIKTHYACIYKSA